MLKRSALILLTLCIVLTWAGAEESCDLMTNVLIVDGLPFIQSEYIDGYTTISNVRVIPPDGELISYERFAQAVQVKDGSIDIFCLPTRSGLKHIKRNGYFFPLESSEILSIAVELLYPSIREAITEQGHLVGWPILVSPVVGSASVKSDLETLGFAYPETFDEYLDTCAALRNADWWNDQKCTITDLYPFDRVSVLQQFVELYVFEQMLGSRDEISFDTETFRRIVGRIMTEVPRTDSESFDVRRAYLIMDYAFDMISEKMLPPLRISVDGPIATDVDMVIAIVNPYSEQPEQALAFLEYLSRIHDKYSYFYYRLSPYVDAGVETKIAEATAELTRLLEKQHNEPDEAKELQLEIETLQKSLSDLQQSTYIISPAALATYQNLADGFIIADSDDLRNDAVIKKIIKMYTDGALSLEEMIKQLDNHVAMVLSE